MTAHDVLLARRGGGTRATFARLKGRHRADGGNASRAAVLGANDGLVSNLSLVMGVAVFLSGTAAAAVTYGIGAAIGVSVAA